MALKHGKGVRSRQHIRRTENRYQWPSCVEPDLAATNAVRHRDVKGVEVVV